MQGDGRWCRSSSSLWSFHVVMMWYVWMVWHFLVYAENCERIDIQLEEWKNWNLVPLALMWVVWRERNRRTFDGVEWSFPQLRSSLRSLIFFWYTHKSSELYRRLGGVCRESSFAVESLPFGKSICIQPGLWLCLWMNIHLLEEKRSGATLLYLSRQCVAASW